MYTYDSLETFWKRFSKVSLDKLALEKERSILQSENMQLKMLLKQYLDGISVNDEIMSQTNPLMILSSRRVLEYVFIRMIHHENSILSFLEINLQENSYLTLDQPKSSLKHNMSKVLFEKFIRFFDKSIFSLFLSLSNGLFSFSIINFIPYYYYLCSLIIDRDRLV